MYVHAGIHQSSHQVLWIEGFLNNPPPSPTCTNNIATWQESLYDCTWTGTVAVSEQS